MDETRPTHPHNRRSYRLNVLFPSLLSKQRRALEQIDLTSEALVDALINDGKVDAEEALPILRNLQRARGLTDDNCLVLTEWDHPNGDEGMEQAQREVERQQQRDRTQ